MKKLIVAFLLVTLSAMASKNPNGPIAKFDKETLEYFMRFHKFAYSGILGQMPEIYFKSTKKIDDDLQQKLYKQFGLKIFLAEEGREGTVVGYTGNALAFAGLDYIKSLTLAQKLFDPKRSLSYIGLGSENKIERFFEDSVARDVFKTYGSPALGYCLYKIDARTLGVTRESSAYTKCPTKIPSESQFRYKLRTMNEIVTYKRGAACAHNVASGEDWIAEITTVSQSGVLSYQYVNLNDRGKSLPALKNKKGGYCVPRLSITAKELGLGPVSGL